MKYDQHPKSPLNPTSTLKYDNTHTKLHQQESLIPVKPPPLQDRLLQEKYAASDSMETTIILLEQNSANPMLGILKLYTQNNTDILKQTLH
jgi:hypothetical protein